MSPDPTRPDAGQQHGPESVALPGPLLLVQGQATGWENVYAWNRAQVEQYGRDMYEAGRRAERAEVADLDGEDTPDEYDGTEADA